MTRFSPSESALQGFRLVKDRPGTVLAWSIFYFLGIMVMAVVMVLGLGPGFIRFVQQGGMKSGDLGAYGSVLQHSWPAFVLILLIAVFVLSVLTASIYRMVLRPEEKGIAHMRIGADELRLTVVNVVLFTIGMVSLIVVKLFADAVGGLLGVVAGLILAGFVIWGGVRLLMATPMTFAEHRIAILASWRLTHGHFWSLLGMSGLAIIFYFMVWVLFTVVGYIFIALAGGQEAMAHPMSMGPVALFAFAVTLLVQLLLPTLQVVMIYSPLAEAYRELRDETAEAAASLHSKPAPT
ncbi:MAG TPA: hypothetical protein VFW47_17245 [Phenylobacterium sp.]|nr:hypothetical protein [Phenylobacterium sp.]